LDNFGGLICLALVAFFAKKVRFYDHEVVTVTFMCAREVAISGLTEQGKEEIIICRVYDSLFERGTYF